MMDRYSIHSLENPVELLQRALTPQLVVAKRRSRLIGAAGSFNKGLETYD
jgi:hypothetical protein